MSIQDEVGVYDEMEFADNPEARCSIVMVLDVSESMIGVKIDTLNQALVKFRDIIRQDPVTALRADVAIVAFDDVAWVLQDFTNGTGFEAPRLEVKGGTNFSQPVNMALDLIEARKQSYRDSGVAYYRSLVYFLTDGIPDDDPADLRRTAQRLAAAEGNRSVAFFPFIIASDDGIPDFSIAGEKMAQFYRLTGFSEKALEAEGAFGQGTEGARGLDLGRVAELTGETVLELVERCVEAGVMRTSMGELTKLAPRQPIELTHMRQLEGSIEWLSNSVNAVSQSQPGDSLRLPQLDFLDV